MSEIVQHSPDDQDASALPVVELRSDQEREKKHSVSLIDFITQPVPDHENVDIDTIQEYDQKRETIVRAHLEEQRNKGTYTPDFPYDSFYIVEEQSSFQEKIDTSEVSKQRGSNIICQTKLRLLGIREPSSFIDATLSQYALYFYKRKKESGELNLTGIDYKKIINFAKRIKEHTNDPVKLIKRLTDLGIADNFFNNDDNMTASYQKVLELPDDLFQQATAYLKTLPWLDVASTADPRFQHETITRINFVSNFENISALEQVGLTIQEILTWLGGKPIDMLSVVLDNPESLQDLLVVAEELFMEAKKSGKLYEGLTRKLRNLFLKPDKLTNIAESIRNGKRFEVNKMVSSLDSNTWHDSERFDHLTDSPLVFTENQEKLADRVDLHTFETHNAVINLEQLIDETVSSNMDMMNREALLTSLTNDDNSHLSIEQTFRRNKVSKNSILVKWMSLDKGLVHGTELDYPPSQTRTLLFVDKDTIDSELISYLMHRTDDIPINSYLDEKTIALLPDNDRTMINLLKRLDVKKAAGLWDHIVENKEDLSLYVDNSGNVSTAFIEWYLTSESAHDASFRKCIPLFEGTNLPHDFIDYSERLFPSMNQFHLKYKDHAVKVFKIFTSNDDSLERDLELAKYWENYSQPLFIKTLSKKSLNRLLGDKKGNSFLSALPKDTNERRNAFLHNNYDRTSAWLIDMTTKTISDGIQHDSRPHTGHGLYGVEGLGFTLKEDVEIATEFIQKFGLANNPQLFVIFKALYVSETDSSFKIPEEIMKFGLESKQDLYEQYSKVQGFLVDTQPLIDTSNLTDFQMILLSSATGRDTHSFTRGDTMTDITERFSADYETEMITPLDPEHTVENLTFSDIEITYEASDLVKKKFNSIVEISNEVFEELNSGSYWKNLVSVFGSSLEEAKVILESKILHMPGEKQKYPKLQLEQLNQTIGSLKDIDSVDSAMSLIGSYNPDKQMTPVWESLLQKMVFYKMLEVGGVNQKLQSLVASIELTPKSLLTAINIYDEVIKHHVINFSDDDSSVYWNSETRDLFTDKKMKKQMKRLRSVFQSVVRVFKEDVSKFQKEVLDTTTSIDAIPDKGLIGEMSGYIANACYTGETSLLANWPVTPYKFVDRSKSPPEVIGTALLFDVQLESGENALLVRAINIPEEDKYDIQSFCEKYIDIAASVAQKKGATKVLIPGLTGSMSNYQMTINHLKTTYCEGEEPVSLSEEFRFNGYDLTNNCYVARSL